METSFQIGLDKRTASHTPKKFLCPSCGKKTFVRYYDFEARSYLPDEFGKCDRQDNCGCHNKPDKDYFKAKESKGYTKVMIPQSKPINEIKPVLKPDFIPLELVNPSFDEKHTAHNHFIQFLANHFGSQVALRIVNKYHIGTSKHQFKKADFPDYLSPRGANIFWQVDIEENVRGGKIMLYNQQGKRVKEPFNHVTWVHSVLKMQDFNLVQCFFGEHLLNESIYPENKSKTIAIVESAKSAVIADECLKHLGYVWLSNEGSEGMNIDKCKVLKNRKVILFPDLDRKDLNYEKWSKKGEEIAKTYYAEVSVSDVLYNVATEEDREKGCDIADYLLRLKYDKERQILLSPYGDYPFSWD